MHSHAPSDYICPFCNIVKGVQGPGQPGHAIFYQDKYLTAFISSRKWPKGGGNAIIVTNRHFENIYETPDGLLAKTHVLAKRIALAMKKTYGCDGVSTRQHNE